MNVPESLLYADTHEWLRIEGDRGTVGITDHAQNELSDVVYVELPTIGRRVEPKAAVAVVESVKAASDIYAPVGGEIIEVNTALSNDPALVNSDPFGAGWIFKIKLADPAQTSALKDALAYRAQIGG
ncbi:MAG: glycine cleavage system protein GcvH [Candidatus Methylacidiphilales bacterium]